MCQKSTIVLKDVPYLQENGKINIRLNGSEITKYISVFTDNKQSRSEKAIYPPPFYVNWTAYDVKGILDASPDAYFELTLE